MEMEVEWTNKEEVREAQEYNNQIQDAKRDLRYINMTEKELENLPMLSKEDLRTEYRWYFEWSTYAVVDEEGWHSKGEMGWFGYSSDESDDREDWGRGFFERFVLSQEDDTYIAVVDCHV